MAAKFQNERYECPSCRLRVEDPESTKTRWRCSSCGGFVYVYAEDWDGKRQVIERVPASCIAERDMLVLDASPLRRPNEVLAATADGCGTFRIALKGHGAMARVPADREFNRIVGTW